MAPPAERLHLLNYHLEKYIAGVRAGSILTPGLTLSSLFEQMCEHTELLAHLPAASFAEARFKDELASYRKNLLALSSVLPVVEALLLAEKARLQVKRSHLLMASQWLAASRTTLGTGSAQKIE